MKNTAVLNWYTFLRIKYSFTELVISLLLLITILNILAQFLLFVELRQGIILKDPILSVIPSFDFTWLIFIFIYGGLFAAIIFLSLNPGLLVTAIQSYIIMLFFRILMMYIVPLDAPGGIIPLRDPLVEMFGTGQLLNKDLFFSGHTATMFLLFLTVDQKYMKLFFLITTVIIGGLVIVQHVHYTVDVLAAPFFAYCSYRIAVSFHEKLLSAERNK